MTKSVSQCLSMAELEASTPEGARELAAAEIMVRASTLMNRAFEQSGLTQKELAEALSVTEGRVSQILHGDGNVRLSTLARYLRATGYLTFIDATPADPTVAPLRHRSPRRSRRRPQQGPDVYISEVEHEGVPAHKLVFMPHGVPHDAPERSEATRIVVDITSFTYTSRNQLELENR